METKNLTDIEIMEIELAKNTTILTSTFDQCNLNVVSLSYNGDEEMNIQDVWLEFSGDKISTPNKEKTLYFHINFYGEKGLFLSANEPYEVNSFLGYDTVNINYGLYKVKKLLEKATSAKLFVSFND